MMEKDLTEADQVDFYFRSWLKMDLEMSPMSG